MNLDEAMQFAGRATQIVRARKNFLYTFGATRLPYVCLSESPAMPGDVVIRRGEVTAEPPRISVPGEDHHFEGFELPEGNDDAMHVLLARRVAMPPAKYVNKSDAASTERGPLDAAVERAVNRLDQANDIRTAVLTAPNPVWTISVLLYVGTQMVRSAPANVHEHFERLRLRGGGE